MLGDRPTAAKGSIPRGHGLRIAIPQIAAEELRPSVSERSDYRGDTALPRPTMDEPPSRPGIPIAAAMQKSRQSASYRAQFKYDFAAHASTLKSPIDRIATAVRFGPKAGVGRLVGFCAHSCYCFHRDHSTSSSNPPAHVFHESRRASLIVRAQIAAAARVSLNATGARPNLLSNYLPGCPAMQHSLPFIPALRDFATLVFVWTRTRIQEPFPA